jgi:hypothetical protein
VAAPIFIKGYASIWPDFYFWSDITGTGSFDIIIDSVKTGESLCTIERDYWIVDADPYYYAWYENVADTIRFESGDIVSFSYYIQGVVSSGSVKLLDYDNDAAFLIESEIPDMVMPGNPITFVWNSIPNADMYSIWAEYDHPGSVDTSIFFIYNGDTTYTVPSSQTTHNGLYRFWVIPVNGPLPNALNGNITGGIAAGTIYSYANTDYESVNIGILKPSTNPEYPEHTKKQKEIMDYLLINGFNSK